VRFHLEAVGLSYRGKRALGPVTLIIPSGTCVAVVGASGSGKTTLLNLLGLLWDRSFEGRIKYYPPNGGEPQDYAHLRLGARNRMRSREFGFVLQNSYLLPFLSGRANVGLPLALQGHSPAACARSASDLLRDADVDSHNPLEEAAGRLPGTASGGQRQRMAVLRSMIHQPVVLFADEPLSNLDPFSAEAILALFQRWLDADQERSLIFVSHDLQRLRDWNQVDYYLPLRHGQVVGGELLPADQVTDEELMRYIDPRLVVCPTPPGLLPVPHSLSPSIGPRIEEIP
jgi:putative ABC transport system ATP-binding protein